MICTKPSKSRDFERVKPLEWINGEIVEIKDRVNPARAYTDEKTGKKMTREVEGVRLVFKLEGYEFNHFSRWNTNSTSKKSNLYVKYLKELIPGLSPDKVVNLDKLKGLRVKTMWNLGEGTDGNIYERLEMIQPIDKLTPEDVVVEDDTIGKELEGSTKAPF